MPYNPTPFNYYGTSDTQIKDDLDKANQNFSILAQAFYNNDPTQPILRGSYLSFTPPSNPVPGMVWADTSFGGPVLWVYDGKIWHSNVVSAIRARDATNSDNVDGFHASLTPSANTIVPLNSSGILDLSSTYIKSNVYTFRRVDLTNATSDYMLQVGEEAYISFSGTTSVPLRIATQSGTLYNLYVYLTAPSFTPGTGITYDYAFLFPNNTAIHYGFYNVSTDHYVVGYPNYGTPYHNYGRGTVTSGFGLIGQTYPANCFSIIYNDMSHKAITSISVHSGESAYQYTNTPDTYVRARLQLLSSVWTDTITHWTSLGTITFPLNSSGYILVRRLA